ncbi:MAG: hypothetical protein ACI32E_01515 [Bacilli bacterium]
MFYIYVSDDSEEANEKYRLLGERSDIVIECDGKYYDLNCMSFKNMKKNIRASNYLYVKNLLPLEEVTLEQIIDILRFNNSGQSFARGFSSLKEGTTKDLTNYKKISIE